MQRTLLIVDDNDINRLNLRLLLKDTYQVIEAGDCTGADKALAANRIDLMVLDLALPPEPDNPEIGMAYLKRLRNEAPDLPVVVITGHHEHDLAVRARKHGALDFFVKPFHPEEVRDTIDRAMAATWQRLREQELKRQLEVHVGTKLLGDSEAMGRLRQLIAQVAPTPSTVLIYGETGSGKELVARTLHAQSERVQGPFVAINCAAMAADHLESELFGYEKGAHAGAGKRKLGWFERASGGTLLLDEIAGLPLAVQGRLLRVLESGEFTRLGGDAVLHCDVRLLCSSQQALLPLVEAGRFREDLYYRVQVVEIHVPPLRQHMQDVPLLANHFLERKALLCNKLIKGFSEAAMEQLLHYDWPGNVRELENVIERAVVLACSDIIEGLPQLAGPRSDAHAEDPLQAWLASLPAQGIDGEAALDDVERRLVLTALDRCGGVKARAGRWLGFGERAKDKMRYLCTKHGILPGGEGS